MRTTARAGSCCIGWRPRRADDVEVFAEDDPAWFIGIEPTRLGRAAIISVHGHDASEALVVDLDHPIAAPRLVAPRRPGIRYEVMDHGDRFFIRTNAGAADFKIVIAPRDAPQEANWRDFVAERDGRFIADATLFKDQLVLLTREMSRPRLSVIDLKSGESHEIAFEEETYFLRFEPVYEFDTSLIRFSYSSLARPQETYDYDVAKRRRTLVKRQTMPRGFDPEGLCHPSCFRPRRGRRERAGIAHPQAGPERSTDRRRSCSPATAPMAIAVEASFSTNRFSLVDRGFVFAIAHVRGGTDKGWRWYEDGKLGKKPNSFHDFLAAARFLIAEGYTGPGRIVAQGGSAGGLLMGAVANLAPDLFAGLIADVPFVDVLATMLDASLPLTPAEWLEWGDPIHDRAAFDTIRSYSPIDNVRAQRYPAILALAGLADPRVTYWEPAKWVARLRATMTGGGPILLRTAMEAGHAGAPGRFDRLEDVARQYAFAIACVEGGLRVEAGASLSGPIDPGPPVSSRARRPSSFGRRKAADTTNRPASSSRCASSLRHRGSARRGSSRNRR